MSRHLHRHHPTILEALAEASHPDFSRKQARLHIERLDKRLSGLDFEIERLKQERVQIVILRDSLLIQHFPEELEVGVPRLSDSEYD